MNKILKTCKPKIAFIGMSHLGIVSSIIAATKGFNIVCYDQNEVIINNLSNGILDIKEPNLKENMINYSHNLKFTNDINYIKDCDIIYLSIDIKTDDQGNSFFEEIENYLRNIDTILSNKNELVILSQVNPGFTRNIKIRVKKIYYQVETLVFGNAVDRASNPERIIIGLKDKNNELSNFFKTFLESFNCPLIKMSYESAELTKISINLFLIAQVTVTNTISSICEKIGADWSEMYPALKLDKRIGEYSYLNPGLGISGGNLERDMSTTIKLAEKNNLDCSLIHSFKKNSLSRKNWVYKILRDYYGNPDSNLQIAVLGLSYKENTNSVKNSPALEILKLIPETCLLVYDPIVKWEEKWHFKAKPLDNMYDVMNKSDALLIMTPWKEFENIDLVKVKKLMKGNLIIDPYGMIKKKNNILDYFSYFCLGK
jgi:UDPglucose 6-dehydrogenase